ncbi:rano class II histocompatibility antigen, A beta chain-like isoform X2 [Pimephales promelas]|uniref:rano class II histocompatibility antigen, A beta chain-like isoform X2 n=1 Tax=Pimephales promelas TaxID=90988 RepID=UPI001955EAD9|nr:rano class II histocompatibility antigen, A beta chain-like isoform X2 [Pimephales promelas]
MSPLKHLSCHLILTLAVFIGAKKANEYHSARWSRCFYSSSNLDDMVLIESFYFNKYLFVQFNSTVGKFVGFNEYGISVAEDWNNSPFVISMRESVDADCRFNIRDRDPAVRDKSVKPKVKLSLVEQAGGSHPAVLICSAYEFYPKHIKVSWLRDGEVMTSDMTSVMEMADGDWYYQIHSEIAYIPKSGEKISCMVEHASSTQPIVTDWEPSLPVSEKIKIGIGVSFLVLGVIIAVAGLIYYKIKLTGQ